MALLFLLQAGLTAYHYDFKLLTLLLSFLAKKKEVKKVAFFAKANS
jgi:hypothetical protein